MDYETLYFELLEDVQNFEKSVHRKTTLNRSCWNGCIENRIGEM